MTDDNIGRKDQKKIRKNKRDKKRKRKRKSERVGDKALWSSTNEYAKLPTETVQLRSTITFTPRELRGSVHLPHNPNQ